LLTISKQRNRAIKYDKSIFNIINLLRIKPSDRAYFMKNFRMKASKQNIDLRGIQFLNTSIDTI